MKTMIKKLCYGLFAVMAALCFAFAGVNLVGAEEGSAAKITMNAGAAIRPADGEYGTGLRFFAKLSKADYDALVAADNGKDKLEFGIILTVKDFYDKDNSYAIGSGEWKEFVVGGENNPTDMYYLRGKCSPKLDTDDADNDGDTSEMLFMFSITDVLDSNLARKFVAKAYYTTDGESFVYSEAVVQRSIFEVATRAYANEAYKDEVAPIIDKVCEAYKSVSFSVVDAETEKKVGDKLAITATLSDGNGNAVEAYATATAAKDGMLTENADGTYTINRLGNFTITAALGFDSVKLGETKTQEIEIKNADTRELVMMDEIYAEKDASQLSEMAENTYYYAPVYKWDVSAVTTDIRANVLGMKSDAMKIIHEGDYLLFDVYKAAAIKCIFDASGFDADGNKVTGAYGMYASGEDGTMLTGSAVYFMGIDGGVGTVCDRYLNTGYYLGKWHTVAIKFNNAPASLSFGFTGAGTGNIAYLKNFRIAASVENSGTMTTIANSEFNKNGDSTIETVEIGGRKNVLKYTATQKGETGVLAINGANTSVTRPKLTSWVSGKGTAYLSFDIYAESAVDLYFHSQGKIAGATGNNVYKTMLGNTADYQTNSLYTIEMFAGDKAIDLTQEDINDYLNQWVTVRITLKSDIQSVNVNDGKWGAGFAFNTVSAEGSTIYISNAFLGQPA